MAKKLSKYRNSGLLFELLIQKITADLMNGIDKPIALSIIKEHFNERTELYKELELYKSLLNNPLNSINSSTQLITETCNQRKKLNQEKLRKEKFDLIKKINECYDETIYDARVPNYKLLTSIHKLFEHKLGKLIPPIEVVNAKETIVTHIMRNSSAPITEESKFTKLDEDLQIIAYDLLIDKFNEKYKSLNNRQKKLLKEYIKNASNDVKLKQYIDSEILYVKKALSRYIPKIEDDITKIKINALNESIKSIFRGKVASNKHVATLMSYYQLITEIRKEINE